MSCETCGWAAAVASALAFGSFGVPIKSDAAKSVDIDPLVFQSYKTFMCFVTAWHVLFFEEFQFSPWGIVSGLFWVPGGVATIYAVKSAGLAIGIGIGSSFIVLVSFVWGVFIFQESVRSRLGACVAVLFMMLGLMGMSYYSSPTKSGQAENDAVEVDDAEVVPLPSQSSDVRVRDGDAQYQDVPLSDDIDVDETGAETLDDRELGDLSNVDSKIKASVRTEPTDCESVDSISVEEESVSFRPDPDTVFICCGKIPLSKRHRGMLAAMFCGVWGGSVMAPMKWCKSDTQGTSYLISFAIGASLVTLSLWLIRYIYNVIHFGSFTTAYTSLPSFHVSVMWRPGCLSGLLWSIGNYFSLISVLNLGEGVGYPLSQTSIIVSGIWGIYYFREISGSTAVRGWLMSAMVTVAGILLLSYEHHSSGGV